MILEGLIELVRWPFEAAKRLNEDSGVGPSDADTKAVRFWKWFAWIGTAALLGVPVLVWISWKLFVG